MDKEKFNLKYLLTGEGKKDWFKAWGNGVKILISVALAAILCIGILGVYRFFFPKKTPQTQNITVESGGHATIIQNESKDWEIGVFAGALSYDNKNGGIVGVHISRRW